MQQMSKARFPILLSLAIMALCMGLLLLSSSSMTILLLHSNQQQVLAQKQQVQQLSSSSSLPDIVTIQNTSMSVPSPVHAQGIPHQIVVALPLRDDGKIWSGTVTFTASKPIEIEVEHKYNPKVTPDPRHGAPYNTKWFDNRHTPIALSTMTMFSNTPITVTNTPISTGSFVFAGSILVFHKTDGIPFTVTYTIDAVAKPITQK